MEDFMDPVYRASYRCDWKWILDYIHTELDAIHTINAMLAKGSR
jgi:hypothetical protein